MSDEKILGYVNAYRQPDGTIELGSADLEEHLEDLDARAAEFSDHVGKCKVVLIPGTAVKGSKRW